jgi:Na+-driven multidrug efflux pump
VTFSYYGSVRNIWILAESKQKYLFGINVTGAVANILLNLLLIPIWGGVGAAVASLFTQFFTNVIIGFIFKPIQENNRLMLQSFHPRVLVSLIRSLLHR